MELIARDVLRSLSHFLFDPRLTPLHKMSVCVKEEDGAESPESNSLSRKGDHYKDLPLDLSGEPGTSETK